MTLNASSQMPTYSKLTPNLLVADVQRSLTFYVDVLGFSSGMTVPDEPPYVFGSVVSGNVESTWAATCAMPDRSGGSWSTPNRRLTTSAALSPHGPATRSTSSPLFKRIVRSAIVAAARSDWPREQRQERGANAVQTATNANSGFRETMGR